MRCLTLLECENLWRHTLRCRCTSARQNTNLQIAKSPTKSENNKTTTRQGRSTYFVTCRDWTLTLRRFASVRACSSTMSAAPSRSSSLLKTICHTYTRKAKQHTKKAQNNALSRQFGDDFVRQKLMVWLARRGGSHSDTGCLLDLILSIIIDGHRSACLPLGHRLRSALLSHVTTSLFDVGDSLRCACCCCGT